MSGTKSKKPSKEKFEDYVRLQQEGTYNMLAPEVRTICNLTMGEHIYICKHYAELAEEYGVKGVHK